MFKKEERVKNNRELLIDDMNAFNLFCKQKFYKNKNLFG